MVIQMIIKEALASESQAEVYCLTARKLMETATHYFENNKSDEIAVFLDRAIIVMTSMINVKSEEHFIFQPCYQKFARILLNLSTQ